MSRDEYINDILSLIQQTNVLDRHSWRHYEAWGTIGFWFARCTRTGSDMMAKALHHMIEGWMGLNTMAEQAALALRVSSTGAMYADTVEGDHNDTDPFEGKEVFHLFVILLCAHSYSVPFNCV